MSSSPVRRYIKIIVPILVISASMLVLNPVQAQQPTPSDDKVNAIARQLFCPICENTPLDVCPTDACRDWRELIRQMLAQGKSQTEIKQYFVDHYGARVLAEPPPTGLNLLTYILPPAVILVGAYLLFRAYRIWMKAPKKQVDEAVQGSQSQGESQYTARLEEELRKRK